MRRDIFYVDFFGFAVIFYFMDLVNWLMIFWNNSFGMVLK
jgi:hypothetical protein